MDKSKQRLRPNVTYWTDLSDFHEINKNKKCFIVGAGPSLHFLDLSPIHDDVVISVNSSAILMPWRQGQNNSNRFWISTDPLCIHWDYFWKQVVKFNCTRLIRTSWRQNFDRIKNYEFRFFKPRNTYTKIDDNDQGLCSFSSVLAALDFAIKMRCRNIFLVGVDHRMMHDNSHFWQFMPKNKWPIRKDKGKHYRPSFKQQQSVFQKNMGIFKLLGAHADSLGIKIYNCSNISCVNTFEKISIDQAVAI